ncbi:MAG TPA: response regulator [Clostridiales bacterium]|nr:response regulator [Clostridiales bacterium]
MKVLIVDDESATREGLRDLLPWKDLGIGSVYTASDGIEALELAAQVKPDIIITDIRMPRMDGIKYIQNIKAMSLDSRIIFMSAYSDKDYLMSAIKFNATSYVEKPISLEEMTSAIKTAVESLNKQRKSMELLCSSVALSLTEPDISLSDITNSINSLKPDFLLSNNFCTMIIRTIMPMDEIKKQACNMSDYTGIFDDIFSATFSAKMDEKEMVVHVSDKNITNEVELKKSVHRVMLKINQYFNLQDGVFIAVGRCVTGIADIWRSYKTAVEASALFFYTGYGSAVFYDYRTGYETFSDENNYKDTIERCLRFDDKQGTISALERLYIQLKQLQCNDINSVRNIFFNIAMMIAAMSVERLIPAGDENSRDFIWKSIAERETLDDIYTYLVQKVDTFFTYVNYTNARKPIYSIIMYIEKNYSRKSIPIQEIADSVHLTPAYICNAFKKETGKTIVQYLNDYRIEKAKELLKSNGIKLADIADQVGFGDVNYFIKVFKKTTNITPSEYRNKLLI